MKNNAENSDLFKIAEGYYLKNVYIVLLRSLIEHRKQSGISLQQISQDLNIPLREMEQLEESIEKKIFVFSNSRTKLIIGNWMQLIGFTEEMLEEHLNDYRFPKKR